MKKLMIVALVLIVAVAGLSYWRGWFSVTKDGKVDVQVDAAKFKQDKDSFSKTVAEKAKAAKEQIASLWNRSEKLTGDDKTLAQAKLGELKKKHDRLEQQIKELDDAGQGRFESIREDLSNNLAQVEKEAAKLTNDLAKVKAK